MLTPFVNLTDDPEAGAIMHLELGTAGIGITSEPTACTGVLHGTTGGYIFIRAATCWVVRGKVPLEVAKEMDASPFGQHYLCVNGDVAWRSPEEWAQPDAGEMREVGLDKARMTRRNVIRVAQRMGLTLWVDLYLIYTQEALNYFVQTLRQHGLAIIADS
jgi:hypothetical protein